MASTNEYNISNNLKTLEEIIFEQLETKFSVLTNTIRRYPHYGGFLTETYRFNDDGYVYADRNHIVRDTNGPLMWALVALVQALKMPHFNDSPRARAIKETAERLLQNETDNFLRIFYVKSGDELGTPGIPEGLYREMEFTEECEFSDSPNGKCSRRFPIGHDPNNSLVEDAFMTEIFVMYAYLYANWTDFGGEEAREAIWAGKKRAYLQRTEYTGGEKQHGNITVERGG